MSWKGNDAHLGAGNALKLARTACLGRFRTGAAAGCLRRCRGRARGYIAIGAHGENRRGLHKHGKVGRISWIERIGRDRLLEITSGEIEAANARIRDGHAVQRGRNRLAIAERSAEMVDRCARLSSLVGFQGDEKGGFAQRIPAIAVATTAGGPAQTACIWSLGTGNSFTSNGGPKPDLAGCSIMSNGNATCNGHNLGAEAGIAVGTSSGCGKTQVSGATAPIDNFAPLASNIPANTCSSYPAKPSLPASNRLSGAMNLNTTRCGDVQLTGNVTLTGSNTLTIFNGTLDLNGHTLKTESGASATVIFSGTNAASSVRGPSGNGTLDIQAPSSGPWSGVALYQDPRMSPPASSLDITYKGNQPTWNITGLVYLPKSNTTFSGAVNKSSNGTSCFVFVAYKILVNGTGSIFANNNQCAAAGLTPPGIGSATREKLVL